jgi:hypothetical protein
MSQADPAGVKREEDWLRVIDPYFLSLPRKFPTLSQMNFGSWVFLQHYTQFKRRLRMTTGIPSEAKGKPKTQD